MKFENYKEGFEKIIHKMIEKHLEGQTYDAKQAQDWVNAVVRDVVTEVHSSGEFKGYKVMCTATIVQKAGCCMHFSAKCCYNPMCDGNTMVRWENEHFNFFICLYAVIN
mmetsp:Transcript_26439/g.27476  ORF Transcript_26439/g.27476 Transcript_26439/m.27476 type:complete len:109 (+) Transcript_26439:1-327(+)|eukprot:CAMPEP_0170520806 /NCGR_PEP_ID=MMETSP0209-20121228/6140_1 /TAXON_ID=665100 ORGANISM="Litonotus pictus, Strain P1" /NCGR_SAMPLE_ID=MMETSP0209 /ASSEMBLY_ACC=CAM_ASM_000301 /LENGTH=108 /DNA_ID=CAMNT_0010807355 /DNA_START=1 /DNA_END=327 /DNA_ORIENTATION=-